uniref:Uncharacterized protein n=1 Tax=Anguilla anguilla TaxID=7936 RepID=A0A0E9VZW0_ANGAN
MKKYSEILPLPLLSGSV